MVQGKLGWASGWARRAKMAVRHGGNFALEACRKAALASRCACRSALKKRGRRRAR